MSARASRALLWLFVINLGIGGRDAMGGAQVRHALVLAAWLAALKTFALLYQQRR